MNKNDKKGEKVTLRWQIFEEENERWVEENFNEDLDLDNHNEGMNETVEAPSDLIVPLLRFQKEWLAWALKQEESPSRGGILADEMGMGKTVQAIALVLAKRKTLHGIGEPVGPSSSCSSSTVLPKVKCTLVICPVVAVCQWVNEINRFTTKGSTEVLVYHGANRGKSLEQFSEYDFVITTYNIVENEFRKNVLPPKMKCVMCGKLFDQRSLFNHGKHCQPVAFKTEKQSKLRRKEEKDRLKMPESAVDEAVEKKWKELVTMTWPEFKKETDIILNSALANSADVEQRSTSANLILPSLMWDRIILDEAHYIKDRKSSTARAIFALQSSYKWALSGTPLQNRIGELYPLVRFLQVLPYSYYFCKDCDCILLDYSIVSSPTKCSSCGHTFPKHFCWWNKYVTMPIQNRRERKAMFLLKHKILKSILLRRTKESRAADLTLPPRIVSLRHYTLDSKEDDFYKSLYNKSQAQFNTYVQEGTWRNNYAHIFDLLSRLRQAVDHPYLVIYSRTAAMGSGNPVERDDNPQVCGICNEPADDAVVTSCAHVFCKLCLRGYYDTMGQVSCPACFKPLTDDLTTSIETEDQNTTTSAKCFKSSSILSRIQLDNNNFQTSTKIEALREEIRLMIERDGSAKGIVFSQFTSFLDLINYSLEKSGVTCVQLVGSMSMSAREAAITRFKEDPNCRIFLMSLKAGGVALNLTVASHVFMMDPWWNPAIERQAMDRIHRIGQFKSIRITKFVIENTIEERILKLQEKKQLVFEGIVGDAEDPGNLTQADLSFLFS